MSSGLVRSAIVVGVVVVVVAAVKLVPGLWQAQARKDAVDDAVNDVVRDVVRRSVADSANHLPAAAASGDDAHPIVVERRDYTITLPAYSTLGPAEPGLRMRTHLTQAVLPHGLSINLVMIDDRARAPAAFESTVTGVRGLLEQPNATAAVALAAGATHATALRGQLKGVMFVFEVAQFDGRDRSCTVIAEYPGSEAADDATLLRDALATLHMKT